MLKKAGILFLIFVVLQVLDLVTTGMVLQLGGNEANPLLAGIMGSLPDQHPVWSVALAKAACLIMGWYAYWSSRIWALRIINLLFVAIVLWNSAIAAVLAAGSTLV